MLLRWPPKLEVPLDVEGMAFKCQAGQTLAWDVDGMVGPGCYNTWATLANTTGLRSLDVAVRGRE